MIEDSKTGTIKIQVSQFIVNDNNVSNVIQEALKNKGFDIEIKPIFDNNTKWFIGEEFKVFTTKR